MGVAYRNIWSLNTDEAVVSGLLRNETDKNVEVLMPLNSQMKGVDLVVMNVGSKKSLTIQVKGSKAYEPNANQLKEYGHGNVGWFLLSKKTVAEATADYFIFLVYVIEENVKAGRRTLRPHSIVIPTSKLQDLTKKYKKETGKGYSYYFWVNPKTNKVCDIRDKKFYVSKYLDKSGYAALSERLS